MSRAAEIFACLDLTSLSGDETSAVITRLCEKAYSRTLGNVAAICVYPKWVKQVKAATAGSKIAVATVLNFPEGNQPISTVLSDLQKVVADGADEVDVVIPYPSIQLGHTQSAFDLLAAIKRQAPEVKLKAILETGMLSDEAIKLAAETAMAAGADFLKTSTGKVPVGATLAAAKTLLNCIAEHQRKTGHWVGFKASGGVKTQEQAQSYWDLAVELCGKNYVTSAYFRLGASSLVDNLSE